MRDALKSLAIIPIIVGYAMALAGTPLPYHGALPKKDVLRGTLVDTVCVKEEADKLQQLGQTHTRRCLQMPVCEQGGYALLLSSKEVLAFDDHGNDLARKFIAGPRQEKGWMVKVSGTREGNRIYVQRIQIEQ